MARLSSRGPSEYLRAILIVVGLGLIVGLVLTEGKALIKDFTTIESHGAGIKGLIAEILAAIFRLAGIIIFLGIAAVMLLVGLRMKSSSPFLRRDIIDIMVIVLKAMSMLMILFIIQELIFMLIPGEAPDFALRAINGVSVFASGMALLLDSALLALFLFVSRVLRQNR
jgi:hypothetical protein